MSLSGAMIDRKEVIATLREAADGWAGEANRPLQRARLAETYRQEAEDLNTMALFLEHENDKAALHQACQLDTVVLSCLPYNVWTFLDQLAEQNESEWN